MAYMNADTVRQVGFRPYGQTNPRRAANLSGLGAAQHDLNRPFDPWRLHADNLGDLGQNHPFDQDPGGWVLHGLGNISQPWIDAAESAGISAADLDLLGSVGATDNDITDLINGNISLTDLYAKYGVTINPPAPPGSSTQSVPASTSPVGTAPEVPAGSRLTYHAEWDNPSALALGVIPKLTSQLPNYELELISSNVPGWGLIGPSSINLLLQSNVTHASRNDVASIVTSLLQNLVGNTFVSTPQISVIAAGPHQSVPVTAIPAGTSSGTAGAGGSFMTEQSVFPGITNEVLIFAGGAILVAWMFKGRR